MDREESPAIARLNAIYRYPLLHTTDSKIDAIMEAILELDARYRVHSHDIKEGRAV